MRLLLAVLVAVTLMAGCQQPRPPMSPGLAASCADSLLLNEHLAWGEAVEALPPDVTDHNGYRWWQVRYKTGADGAPRLVLVEDQTRWAKLPPPGWVQRVKPDAPSASPAPEKLVGGQWIVDVVGAGLEPAEQRARRAVDANELNQLASRTGLVPAFAVRELRDGRVQLTYGWQGDAGMARDEHVRDWLRLRTRWQSSAWVDLNAE